MGSYNSKQQELQYHSQHENAIYGKGTIFSSNKLPNCYVIKTLRLLHDEHIFKLFEEIQNNQNIYLLSLYGYIMGKSCQCQVERVIKKCVLTYWEFLSFSLKDCIEYRRRISVPFHQNEIWHIIKAAVFGYASFERVNVYLEFQEEYLLINHQGRVRISWQHVQGRNEHLKYYKMEKEWRRLLELERGQSSGQTKGSRNGPKDGDNYRNLLWSKIKNQQLYYSPEQLYSIANLQPVHPQVKLLSIQHLHLRHAAPPPLHPSKPYVTILQLLHHRLQQDKHHYGQSTVKDVFQQFADFDRDDAQLGSAQKDHCAGSQRDVRADDERRVRDQSDGQSGQEKHKKQALHLMSLQSITQYNNQKYGAISNSTIDPSSFLIEIFTRSQSSTSSLQPLKMFFPPQKAVLRLRSVSQRQILGSLGFYFQEMTFFIPNNFSFSLEMLDYRSILRSLSRQVLFLLLAQGRLLCSKLAKERLLFLEAELSCLLWCSVFTLLVFFFLCPKSSRLPSFSLNSAARLQQIFLGWFSLVSDLTLNSLSPGVTFLSVSHLPTNAQLSCLFWKGEHSACCLMVLKVI